MSQRLRISVALLGLMVLSSCLLAAPQPTVSPTPPPITTSTASPTPGEAPVLAPTPTLTLTAAPTAELPPLAIGAMRARTYPGSDIVVETVLQTATGYNRYIVSYQSDGLTLYGLLTVPMGERPAGGWPVILMNHGYIPPLQYSTAQSYGGILAQMAAAGYIVFKPDYHGHDSSPGEPIQPYVSPGYVDDSLNALASIKRYPDANPEKIGVWGHSMGGNITLHELVLTGDFEAAVIMGGVVGSYSDIIDWWYDRDATGVLTTQNDLEAYHLLLQMVDVYGTPQSNPDFWNAIDPTTFISDIETPILVQVGSADVVVPPDFSQTLTARLQQAGKSVTYHAYPGADHNLSPDTAAAVAEAIAFFDQYLK